MATTSKAHSSECVFLVLHTKCPRPPAIPAPCSGTVTQGSRQAGSSANPHNPALQVRVFFHGATTCATAEIKSKKC